MGVVDLWSTSTWGFMGVGSSARLYHAPTLRNYDNQRVQHIDYPLTKTYLLTSTRGFSGVGFWGIPQG